MKQKVEETTERLSASRIPVGSEFESAVGPVLCCPTPQLFTVSSDGVSQNREEAPISKFARSGGGANPSGAQMSEKPRLYSSWLPLWRSLSHNSCAEFTCFYSVFVSLRQRNNQWNDRKWCAASVTYTQTLPRFGTHECITWTTPKPRTG